jgi:hypothetical protein
MGKIDIAKTFATSFSQATGSIAAASYSGLIRFVAILMVIIAVMWSINHFMGAEEREQEGFLNRLGSRLIRIIIGLCLFILILIVKGN